MSRRAAPASYPFRFLGSETARCHAGQVAAAHARAVAEAKGRHIGRPTAWPDDKIDYARLLRDQGNSLGEITSKTGIPKTSLHRYLTPATEQE